MSSNKSNAPGSKRRDKKQTIIIAISCVMGAVVVGLCLWFFWIKGMMDAGNAPPTYVASVSSITGVMSATDPKYTGLVEPQEITKINKDDTRTVSEVVVQEGQQVNIGDVLFRYDTEEMQLSIRQAELELEGIANQITTLQDNKKTLEAEKKKASSDEQFSYTVEIQSVDHQIKSQEYDRSVKQSELEKLKKSLENNEVLAEVAGTIQQINLTPQTDNSGQMQPFIAILSSGEYRVKGTVTELNIGSIYEGQAVTVRSRVDSSTTWHGVIDSISHEPVQDNSNYYYSGMDSGEKSSKYNFFVAMNDLSGLMLGQHVYIEPDLGITNTRTGLWLPSMYVVANEDKAAGYVWAKDENGMLEKRQVMLGEFDEGEDLYEIISGLTQSDYIAVPSDSLLIGAPTTTNASAQKFPDETGGDMNIDGQIDGEVFGGDGIPEGGTETDPGFAAPEGEDFSNDTPNVGEDNGYDNYEDNQIDEPAASSANLRAYSGGTVQKSGEGSAA